MCQFVLQELVMVCPGGKGDEGEKAADQWVLRLSMASHRIVQAEYVRLPFGTLGIKFF